MDFPAIVSFRITLALSCFSLGPLLAASGRAQEADQVYRKALEFTPDGPDALNLLAALLILCPEPKFRDPSRALNLVKKSLELAPHNGQHWNTLGIVHYRLGNWKDAVVALEKSMELLNGLEESFNMFFLAMARWQLGDKEQAHKWYDQAVQRMQKDASGSESLG